MNLRSRHGLTLGAVLLVALLVTVLGFALAAMSVTHLRLGTVRDQGETLRNRACSLVALALGRVMEDPEFGTRGESVSLPDGSRLSFDSGSTVYSTNNIGGTGAVTGWNGRLVPKEAIHLVARVEQNGVARQVEALYGVPAFPYAVAAAVPVLTEGAVTIGAVENLEDVNTLDLDQLLPADLVTNSNADPAVRLSPRAVVTGDLAAVGTIELAPGATVRGQVRRTVSESDLPAFDIGRFDPGAVTAALRIGPNGHVTSQLTGLVRHSGDLTLSGPLELDNGVLFVDGDLRLNLDSRGRGGLHGVGAVVTTGRAEIYGGSRFSSENGLALVSRGGVSLHGDARESSYFQGLLYSEGPFLAENLTLLGSLIVRSQESEPVVLRDAVTLHHPELTTIEIPEPYQWTVSDRPDVARYRGQNVNITESQYSVAYDPRERTLVIHPQRSTTQYIENLNMAHREVYHEALSSGGRGEPITVQVTDELLASENFLDGLEFEVNSITYRESPLSGRQARRIWGTRTVTLTGTEALRQYVTEYDVRPTGDTFSFDPNRFLKLSEKIRLVFWNES